MIGNIVVSWVVTLPAGGILAAIFFFIFKVTCVNDPVEDSQFLSSVGKTRVLSCWVKLKIGRAACRERGWISAVAVSLK